VKDTADIVSNLHLALSSHHVSQRSAPRFLSGVLCSLMGPSGQELAVGEPVITAAFPIPCVPVGSPSSVSLYSPQLIFFFLSRSVFAIIFCRFRAKGGPVAILVLCLISLAKREREGGSLHPLQRLVDLGRVWCGLQFIYLKLLLGK